ncbi:MAG TPA: hypothetical protein VNA28_13690 [Solirubrobacteraceae bacterium]|nr:hypothetical protein [Solirubrobacteraceae bacterium]
MPSTVTLQNGEKIETDEDPQVLVVRFNASRRDGTLIKIEARAGSMWINPHVLATISPGELASDGSPVV